MGCGAAGAACRMRAASGGMGERPTGNVGLSEQRDRVRVADDAREHHVGREASSARALASL